MPADDHDLSLLIDATQAAGRIAAQYSGPDAKRWDKPGGAGPVTEADLAVDTYLRERLLTARPDYGWLSEETEDSPERLARDTVFIVDPIDGTRSFVEGARTWAVSVAVAREGQVTAAAIALPQRDKFYAAVIGQGATLNGVSLSAAPPSAQERPRVLGAKPNFEARHWPGGMPKLERHYRPSLAYRMALVGEGRFDGMLTLRATWEWDIAAGALIVSEAGGRVTDRRGAPLRFNSERAQLDGVIAATPALHAQLQAGLS